MTRKLQFLLTALLLMVGVTSAWAQTSVAPDADTFFRYSNSDNKGSAEYIEVHNTATTGDRTDFVGAMTFTIPATPSGKRIKSANLFIVTKRVKTTVKPVYIYSFGAFAESGKYADYTTEISNTRQIARITSFTPNGNVGKDVTSDEITTDAYKSISAWQQNVDVTNFVKSILSTKFSILLDAESGGGDVQFFSNNATAFTNSKTSITNTAEDLKPKLVITYEDNTDESTVVSIATADTWVRSDNTSEKKGTLDNFEVKNDATGTKYFYGLVSFNIIPCLEIERATLRLTSRKPYGDRVTAIRAIDYTINESTTDYSAASDKISAALETDPITKFVMKGQNNKAIFDSGLSAVFDKDLSAWQNSIDLTAYVKSLSKRSFTLLISRVNDDSNSSSFFSKEVTDKTWNSNSSKIDASDLEPELVVVYKKPASYTLTVSSAKAATLCLPYDATIPSGVTAYTLAYTSGEDISATEVTGGTLSAKTPVLIISENATDYTFTRTGEIVDGTITEGVLVGNYAADYVVPATSGEEPNVNTNYILSYKDSQLGFRKVDGSTNKVQPYRAYLSVKHADAQSAREFFGIDFGGETTGVSEELRVKSEEFTTATYYNLAGQRVEKPTRGLYIVNGKKVIIK